MGRVKNGVESVLEGFTTITTMTSDFPAGRSATMAGDFPTMTDRRASGWRFGGFLICGPAGGRVPVAWWPGGLVAAGGQVAAGGRVYKKS